MRLLRERQFALLFAGQAINAIGSWCALVAIWGYAAYRFDSGPTQIALLAMSWALPSSLFSPLAGNVIDRLGPRRVLVGANLLGALAALLTAWSRTFTEMVALGALMGTAKAFGRPAAEVLPPRLVHDDDLLAANALLGAASESAIVFGPLVAAAAISVWGLRSAFVVDAVTYLVGVAVVLPLRLSPIERRPRERLRHELAEGLRMARTEPLLRYTFTLSAAVFVTWSTFIVVEPIYVRDVLHRSPQFFAMLQVAFGVGLVTTSLSLPRLGERVATPRALAWSVALSGIAAATYIGTRSAVVAMLGVFLWGVDVAFFSAPARTLLQRGSPVWAHGRVLSLHTALHSWADLVALPSAGVIAGAVSVQGAGVTAAAIAIATGCWGLLVAPRAASGPDVTPLTAWADDDVRQPV